MCWCPPHKGPDMDKIHCVNIYQTKRILGLLCMGLYHQSEPETPLFVHLTGQTSSPPQKKTKQKSKPSSLVADKLVLVLSSPSWWVQPCIDWRFKHGEYMLWSSRWRLYKQSSRSSCRPIALLCLPTILKNMSGSSYTSIFGSGLSMAVVQRKIC